MKFAKKRLKEESIQDAIRQKEQAALAQMSLSELLALDPEQPIPDDIRTEKYTSRYCKCI